MRREQTQQVRELKEAEIEAMFRHLRSRAEGQAAVERLIDEVMARPDFLSAELREVEAWAHDRVKLAKAVYAAGRITLAELALHVSLPLEHVQDRRISRAGFYPELERIAHEMEKIEYAHGLEGGEYWLLADAPPDYVALSEEYSRETRRQFANIIIEFGVAELGVVSPARQEEFDRLREAGRRRVFEEDQHEKALASAISVYEAEADRCEKAEAFYAACTMLGAAAEAHLVLFCLSRPELVQAARGNLPGNFRPSGANPFRWNFGQLITLADAGGWLGKIEDDQATHLVSGWLNRLRGLRNLLHPARHVEDLPHVFIGLSEFSDAKAAYTALVWSLSRYLD